MDAELRARAESRLAEAARSHGLADPRPPYRERLRLLKQTQPDAFDRAREHYEQRVLHDLAAHDPLPVWIEYGRFLASLSADGSTLSVDASGRATPWTGEALPGLVLFVPEDTASEVLVLSQPAEPSPAQRATVDLLVERKLGL